MSFLFYGISSMVQKLQINIFSALGGIMQNWDNKSE